jgi:hypothetical protein
MTPAQLRNVPTEYLKYYHATLYYLLVFLCGCELQTPHICIVSHCTESKKSRFDLRRNFMVTYRGIRNVYICEKTL